MNGRAVIALLAALSLASTACEPVKGDPHPGRKPQPAPDPSAMASVGRDKHSVLLYVGWEHEYVKIIGYADGGIHSGTKAPQFDQPAQTPKGGDVWIPTVFRPDTLYRIDAEPKHARENRGLTHCWILWNGEVQDRDTQFNGQASCTWLSPVTP